MDKDLKHNTGRGEQEHGSVFDLSHFFSPEHKHKAQMDEKAGVKLSVSFT